MPVKTVEAKVEKSIKPRGKYITLEDKEYFIRKPKAKDMVEIEKVTSKEQSQFMQGLIIVSHLCDDLTVDYLLDLYVEDLNQVFDVFNELLPSDAVPNK